MRMQSRLARVLPVLVLALAALAVTACSTIESPPPDQDYLVGTPLDVPSFDALWEKAKMTVKLEGYGLDPEHTRFSEKTLATEWQVRLAPSRFKGKRRRTWIEFNRITDTSYQIRLTVQTQRNTAIEDPLTLVHADWEEQPPDEDRAQVLMWKIEHAFRPIGEE